MNNLITTDVKMTSLDIAEVTGKEHKNVLVDIRKEISELGDEVGQLLFQPSTYTNKQNREMPCYEFGKEGAMQLALKYDAKMRYEVIQYVEKLENKPQSQLEILQGTINQLVEQDNRINVIEQKQNDIKEIFSITTINWRKEVNRIVNKVAQSKGGAYKSVRNRTYNDLEIRARVDLSRRLNNMKDRAAEAGAGKKEITNMNYLDVIERDNKLTEIYLTIVKELAIKNGLEFDAS